MGKRPLRKQWPKCIAECLIPRKLLMNIEIIIQA